MHMAKAYHAAGSEARRTKSIGEFGNRCNRQLDEFRPDHAGAGSRRREKRVYASNSGLPEIGQLVFTIAIQ